MIYTIPISLTRQRTSPIQQARRDFVIDATDNFRLAVTIYENESASEPLDLEEYRLFVRFYTLPPNYTDDYGWPHYSDYPELSVEAEYQGDGLMWADFPSSSTRNICHGRLGILFVLSDTEGSAVIGKGIINITPGEPALNAEALPEPSPAITGFTVPVENFTAPADGGGNVPLVVDVVIGLAEQDGEEPFEVRVQSYDMQYQAGIDYTAVDQIVEFPTPVDGVSEVTIQVTIAETASLTNPLPAFHLMLSSPLNCEVADEDGTTVEGDTLYGVMVFTGFGI